MKKARAKKKQQTMTRPLVISAILHIIVVLLVLFMPADFLIDSEPEPEITWIELPKGKGEDIEIKEVKKLPEKPVEEVKPIKPLPKKEKVMKEPKKKIVKRPVKSKKSKALEKIEKRLKERELAQTKTKGTGFEHGTSDKPLKDQNYHAALLKYRAQVRAKILRQWIPPKLESGVRQTVRITVFISKSGDVMSTRWAKKSSSEALNQSALRAVRRASPFPIPPDPLKWEAYKEGFSVVFNPPNR